MSEIVDDCPRCHAKRVTMDVGYYHRTGSSHAGQHVGELHVVCRGCGGGAILKVEQAEAGFRADESMEAGLHNLHGNVGYLVHVTGYVSVRDEIVCDPPEHLPMAIEAAFREGVGCLSVGCFNASAAMFRLCVDQATISLLPAEDLGGLNARIRRSLGLRLDWLFKNKLLPEALHDLSSVVKDYGNDGAHAGSISKLEAEDLLDFTTVLLERLYTEPEKIKLAKRRREARRERG